MFTVTNNNLRNIIRNAFGITNAQIVGGPAWIDEDRFVTFDDVCDTALGRALRLTAAFGADDRAHVLGYCLGGTLATIHAAGLDASGIRRFTLRGAGPPMPIILGAARPGPTNGSRH